jgi:tetratricopeptide (TPR) repeat protein
MIRPERPADRPTDLISWRTSVMCLLILSVTLLVYGRSLGGDFLWDDRPGHVTRPELRSLEGLGRIWFEPGATQQYYPLLHSAFWLEHRLWGDSPAGYRILNLLLHATAACLAGVLLRRLAVPGAWLGALLFALHPVGVESVAWISEQKNTLSTLLYLWAALVYWRFDATRRTSTYVGATLLFVLALCTKTVTATLPAALLVIVWWKRGRLDARRDGQPLLPWFVLSAGSAVLTASVERTLIGAQGEDFALTFLQRGLLAGRAAWFYFGKLLWPVDLVFIYPRWTIDAGNVAQWLAPMGVGVALVTLWFRRRGGRGPLAAALLFLGLLFPALGFINVFPFLYSFVADHFQYLASIAMLALIAAGWASAAPLSLNMRRAVAVVVLAVLGALTWRQSGTYRDVITLYEATLAKNPEAWMAHNNLAIAYVEAGRAADALPHYEAALRLRPGYAEAENNFGYALLALNRPADALAHLQRATQLRPEYAEAHNNLGRAFMALARSDEGRAAFAQAVRLDPRNAVAQVNLGLALATAGQPDQALTHFARAAQLDPNYAEAELHWAVGLTVTGRVAEAFPHFERAVRLRPDFAPAHNSWGRALVALGRLDEAIARFREAVRLAPGFAEAHFNLALALRQTGRTEEADAHLADARRLGFGAR